MGEQPSSPQPSKHLDLKNTLVPKLRRLLDITILLYKREQCECAHCTIEANLKYRCNSHVCFWLVTGNSSEPLLVLRSFANPLQTSKLRRKEKVNIYNKYVCSILCVPPWYYDVCKCVRWGNPALNANVCGAGVICCDFLTCVGLLIAEHPQVSN